MLPGHNEKLTHHAGSLTDVLLHQFSTLHSNEAAVSVVGDSASKQGLAGAWWAVKEDALWLGDSEAVEDLGVLDRKLDDLLDFLDLLLQTTHHIVGRVRHLLDLHQVYQWVHL